MKIFRVVVRGQFADLDDAQRRQLLAQAAEHHFLRSAFTAAGTLTYDEQLVAFQFRYEVREVDDDLGEEAIGAAAVERATGTLVGMGLGSKHVRVNVTDMATIWA